MTILPTAETIAAFEALARDDARIVDGARAIAARHALRGDVERFSTGSLPVFAIGDHVLKLFPPCYAHEASTEHDALDAVRGKLAIPTPDVHARGEREGWHYVLMSRLCGSSLAERWATLSASQREACAEAVGASLQQLHALDVSTMRDGIPRPDWESLLNTQRAHCVERQRARGLSATWLERIPEFLERSFSPSPRRSLLHTEVMREHLLASDDGELTGLFDFEPAMIGDPDYDMASVGVFVTGGDRALVRRFVAAYGRDLGPQRFMAYALLHRFSNLRWYLERLPPPSGVTTIDDLADAWWPA